MDEIDDVWKTKEFFCNFGQRGSVDGENNVEITGEINLVAGGCHGAKLYTS